MTIKYIWSVTTLSGQFIFMFTQGTVQSTLKSVSLSVRDDSRGIPIKASTQRHCAGLTITNSYTALFAFKYILCHISQYLKDCFKLLCFADFFPLSASNISLLVFNGYSEKECLNVLFLNVGRLSGISFIWPLENMLNMVAVAVSRKLLSMYQHNSGIVNLSILNVIFHQLNNTMICQKGKHEANYFLLIQVWCLVFQKLVFRMAFHSGSNL